MVLALEGNKLSCFRTAQKKILNNVCTHAHTGKERKNDKANINN